MEKSKFLLFLSLPQKNTKGNIDIFIKRANELGYSVTKTI